MLTEKKISIVVVCFNDGGSIKEMYRRLKTSMDQVTPDWELIYVNDASPDDAWEILQELASQDKRLIAINHARNFGTSQHAYTTGMYYATGEAVITLDGDIQDPPEMFPDLVKKWLEGYDVVYGVRSQREGSVIRKILYKVFYKIFKKMAFINIPLDASDFSLTSRRVLNIMNAMPEKDRYLRGLRAYAGFKSIGIEYKRADRFAGETNFNLRGYFRWARKLLVTFSYRPLEWISHLAAFVTLVSGIAIVVYVILAFYLPAPSGFLTILVVVLFLGSIQLLSLSIIAEYLARMFEEIKHRPTSLVDKIINDYRPEFIDNYNQGKFDKLK